MLSCVSVRAPCVCVLYTEEVEDSDPGEVLVDDNYTCYVTVSARKGLRITVKPITVIY